MDKTKKRGILKKTVKGASDLALTAVAPPLMGAALLGRAKGIDGFKSPTEVVGTLGKKVISGLSGALSRDAVAAHAGRASDYDAMRRRSTANRLKNQWNVPASKTMPVPAPKTMPLRPIPHPLKDQRPLRDRMPKSPQPLKDRIRERRDSSDKRPKSPLRDQSPLRDRRPRFL